MRRVKMEGVPIWKKNIWKKGKVWKMLSPFEKKRWRGEKGKKVGKNPPSLSVLLFFFAHLLSFFGGKMKI